ncbi:sigma 54-interacting transcriptional regulator [Brevibacillus sp. NRS-1366]|uniref:sigma 54-interacting transcriptional regulator n=1 Tax=Brevibacillus sp. NRS-1366 TaxID=3233899 RepID=UPI003D1A07AF
MTMEKMIHPITTYLRPNDTLEDAARVMLETRMDVLPVGDEQGRLVGVFSRSTLYRMILEKLPSDTSIHGFIKTKAVTTSLGLLYEMTFGHNEQNIQKGYTEESVLVDNKQRIVGVLTKTSTVNALVASENDMREEFEQLEAIMHTAKAESLHRADGGNRFAEKGTSKQVHQATYHWDHILTRDKAMKNLIVSAHKAARRNTAILLRGESGTGKELFAHALHNSSPRASGPFVTINCASVPEHLLEAEFFGYETGAFTGADRAGRIGKFELAHKGTLFLDEIGDMAINLQAKLLRAIEGKEFYRIGGTKPIQTDVRIISATNAPIEEMLQQKTFREELYYRLHVVSFSIPPLRMRMNDIMLLAHSFIEQLNPILETAVTGIDESVQRLFYQYEWPGNIRQLRNVIERGMIMAEKGMISYVDLPDELLQKAAEGNGRNIIYAAEKTELARALRETNGNKAKAARLLGISRSVLYEKLKKYQL